MNKQEIIDILNSSTCSKIYKKADSIRKQYLGNKVHLRALIEFSNICSKSCHYCGLRCENKNVKRYRLEKSEILKQAKIAISQGYKTIVLQSGEDNYFDTDKMCEIISEIKKFDCALTLSIGEKTYEEYKAYKTMGADRYLLRIETTDEKLYQKLHPKADFKNRVQCLLNLKSLGYETGSGSLIGLPNQTIESIADDILFFRENDFDMIGIGPLIVHLDTPLKNEKNGSFELALKTMALVRINMPSINIPATTAMETIKKDGQLIALNSGANVIMPNFTPSIYQENYEIYPEKFHCNNKEEIERKLSSIGRYVSDDFGNRIK